MATKIGFRTRSGSGDQYRLGVYMRKCWKPDVEELDERLRSVIEQMYLYTEKYNTVQL